MTWSNTKKLAESFFADSVKGRVTVHYTKYRKSHDSASAEFRIHLDGKTIFKANSFKFERYVHKLKESEPNLSKEERIAKAYDNGIHNSHSALIEMMRWIDSQPEDILHMYRWDITKAFLMLDKRFGKRRIESFDPTNEGPITKQMYELRKQLENDRHVLHR